MGTTYKYKLPNIIEPDLDDVDIIVDLAQAFPFSKHDTVVQ